MQESYVSPIPEPLPPAPDLAGLTPPPEASRAFSKTTRLLMSTPTYRSWLTYMKSAKKQDGSQFTGNTRAVLTGIGSSFLSYVLGLAPEGARISSPDSALLTSLRSLSASQVDDFITREIDGMSKPNATRHAAQCRSVLRLLIRPWLLQIGNLPESNALPTVAPPHTADELLKQWSVIVEIRSKCADCNTGTLENRVRVARRFFRYVYDRMHAEKEDAILTLTEVDTRIRNLFDSLVRDFSVYTGPHAPQPSKHASHTVASILNSHIRPLLRSDTRPQTQSVRERPNNSVRTPQSSTPPKLAPQKCRAEDDSGSAPLQPTPEMIPLTKETFDAARERVLQLLSQYLKRTRTDLCTCGLNDVRIDNASVRIYFPITTKYCPSSPWFTVKDREVNEALRDYVALKRRLPQSKLTPLFFVNFDGSALTLPRKSK